MKSKETVLAVAGIKSLVWEGDDLYDWPGARRIRLDGMIEPVCVT